VNAFAQIGENGRDAFFFGGTVGRLDGIDARRDGKTQQFC
jgi:hypothetical protein